MEGADPNIIELSKELQKKRLNINDANTYLLQDKFDKIAEQAMEKWNIDKEVFADLCLFWVRYNAKWNREEKAKEISNG